MSAQETPDPKKRKRIAKACDSCRKKKIKCDGCNPCEHCNTYGLDCGYTHVEKKRVYTKRKSSLKTVKELQSRLGNMEGLISSLVQKLGTGVFEDILNTKESSFEFENGDLVDNEDSDEIDDVGSSGGSEKPEQNQEKPTISHDSPPIVHNFSESNRTVEFYFGSSSTLSLFTPRGLAWIQSKLAENTNLVEPLKEMPLYVHAVAKYNMKQWLEPIEQNVVYGFPSHELTTVLLQFFFNYIGPLPFLDDSEVREIFEMYYSQEKRLGYSDLLIMNIVLSLAISMKDRGSLKSGISLSQQFNLNEKDVEELMNGMFSNAIYYFHRIGILGDGIRGIQAMLLLASYIETTLLTSATYILISTAIRSAQGLGLHRKESYHGLDSHETERRRNIWWYCYYIDKDTSLKSGRPPIIQDGDISTVLPQEFVYIFNNRESGCMNLALFELGKQRGFQLYPMFYFTQLSKLTSMAHEVLFRANALRGKSTGEILNIIYELNERMESFRASIDAPLRPGQPIDLGPYEEFKDGSSHFAILSLHFSFYYHLMAINRIAFKFRDDSQLDKLKTFEISNSFASQVCLESARQILQLSYNVDKEVVNYVNWTFFYPFSAFVTIFCYCVEYPTAEAVLGDVELLMAVGMSYFAIQPPKNSKNSLKWEAMCLVVNQMIKILVSIYETRNAVKVNRENFCVDVGMALKGLFGILEGNGRGKEEEYPFEFDMNFQGMMDCNGDFNELFDFPSFLDENFQVG